MPAPTALSNEQTKQGYLGQDRQVNIRKNLEEQQKVKDGGLENVEIRKTAKQLGKDDFLQLLITQLTYQDPTAPVKDQQFIAQMAQFSSLEQMQNMASAVNKMADRQGQALIGKFIVGKDFVSGEQISGVAGAFFFDDAGDSFLKVGGRVVSVNDVVLVGDASQFKQEFGGTGQSVGARAGQASQNAPAAQNFGTRQAPRPADASLGHIQKAGESPTAGKPPVTGGGEGATGVPTAAQRKAAAAYDTNTNSVPGSGANQRAVESAAVREAAGPGAVQAGQSAPAAGRIADTKQEEDASGMKKVPVSSEME